MTDEKFYIGILQDYLEDHDITYHIDICVIFLGFAVVSFVECGPKGEEIPKNLMITNSGHIVSPDGEYLHY
jgi:hypothetical protein